MSNITFREATQDDLPQLLSLFNHLNTSDDSTLSAQAALDIWRRISQYPAYHIGVALAENTVVATYSLIVVDNLAHGGRPMGIVENVVVHPNWRGQGIGRHMMQEAMNRCRETGCYKLMLSTNRQRKEAHAFYAALGFAQHGVSFAVEPL